MAMDPYGFRQRQFMTPQFGNANTGTMGIQRPQMPFTGMDIQGPMGSSPMGGGEISDFNALPMQADPFQVSIPRSPARQPQLGVHNFATPSQEDKPFTGMEVQGPLGSAPDEVEQQEPKSEEFDIFEHMYNAPTPALEAYKRHIMSMPKQEDYKAGKYDRFAAALTGAAEGLNRGAGAGYQAARGIVDQRYNQALQNYTNQGQGLGQLAELESQDMNSKMSYAKTAMEQRRADAKEMREGIRDLALNRLTDMQTQDLGAKMKLHGLELKSNEKTGELEVVNMVDGSRRSLGQFAESFRAKETFKTDEGIRAHRVNAGVDFGNQKAMAGVNFDFGLRNKGVDFANEVAKGELGHERAKDLELFKAPLQVKTAVDLFNATQPGKTAAAVSQAQQIREHAARNPIPQAEGGRIMPSQTDIAHDYGIKRAAMENPKYLKFVTDNVTDNMDAALANPDEYTAFLSLAKKYNDESIAAAKPRNGPGASSVTPPFTTTPSSTKVEAPQIKQSPINAPSAPDDPLRAQAIAAIQERSKVDPNIQVNEHTISQVMQMLRGQ